jgi:hypothetical protein
MFKIPVDKFDSELLLELYPSLFVKDEVERMEASLLMRILKMCVYGPVRGEEDISKVKLSEEEQHIIENNDWMESDNLGVRCRCRDLMMRFQQGDRRFYQQTLSDNYLELFNKTRDPAYLVRSLAIRNIAHLYDKAYICQIQDCYTMIFPAWLKDVAKEISKLFPDAGKQQLISYLCNLQKGIDYNKSNGDDERDYIEALHELGYCSDEGYSYQIALSFERTADYYIQLYQRHQKSINMGIFNWMDNSYRNIYKIREYYRPDYLRIQKKYVQRLYLYNQILYQFGVKIPFIISDKMKEYVCSQFMGKGSSEIFAWLISLPFPNNSNIVKKENEQKGSSLYESFPQSKFCNSEGNTVGECDSTESVGNICYYNFRFNMRYAIVESLEYVHLLDDTLFPQTLSLLMVKKSPDFIERDKQLLWIRSIISGLNDDWDLVAYMLTPLIERALHNLAEQRCKEDLTQLHKNLQLEPVLGKDIKMLNGKMDEGARRELELFLNKEEGVNFRNKLAHGLLKEEEILLWGPYLWWIALKIFFKKI